MDKNRLYYGDNLDILRRHIPDESVDLIYLDPPFNSKRNYNIIYDGSTAQAEAFKDTWSLQSLQDEYYLIYEDEAQKYSSIHQVVRAFDDLLSKSQSSLFSYLVMMAIRLVELHRVLKPTGSIYLHCDPTAGHYLKLIMDAVFGHRQFRNEVVWDYTFRLMDLPKFYNRKHDIIYFYAKTNNNFFKMPKTEWTREDIIRTRKQEVHVDESGREWIWMPGGKGHSKNKKKTIDEIIKGGKAIADVWQFPIISSSAKERLGYPTQKPESLLERIISASSNEGDVVLDPFCGCGTTVAMAQRLKRKWIGVDITFLAIELIRQRLLDHYYRGETGLNEPDAKKQFDADIEIFGIPRDLEGARQLAAKTTGDKVRKEFEKWAVFSVGGVYSEVKGADAGMDGYFYLNEIGQNNRPQKIKCPIQVKSGHVGVKDIRDFIHVVDREHAPLGIFITLEGATRNMTVEIAKEPKARLKMGQDYDKVIIVQVQDIIDGKLPKLPIQRAIKQAGRSVKNGQAELFNEED